MTTAATAIKPTSMIDYERWNRELSKIQRIYRSNQPCPHILLQDVISPVSALSAAQHFPGPDTAAWIQYKHQNENKSGLTKRDLFPSQLGGIVDELNSPRSAVS